MTIEIGNHSCRAAACMRLSWRHSQEMISSVLEVGTIVVSFRWSLCALIISGKASRPCSPDASRVTVDGAAGVRFERTAGPAREAQCGARQVDYVLPVPGKPGDWLISAFSSLDDRSPDGRFTQLLVKLFDAIMSTFRRTAD